MWTGTDSIEIKAPTEQVWSIISDVSAHPKLAGSGEVKAVRVAGHIGTGVTWESDEDLGPEMRFTAHSKCVTFNPPKEFAWKSFPPPLVENEPKSVPDVTWWFKLEPHAGGTRLENGFTVIEPPVGAEMIYQFYEKTHREEVIKRGMHQTLLNIKAAAEG